MVRFPTLSSEDFHAAYISLYTRSERSSFQCARWTDGLLNVPAVVLFAFTAPKVYELNKDQIDKGVVTAQGKVNEGWSVTKAEAGKLWDKAPPSIKRVADSFTPKKTE